MKKLVKLTDATSKLEIHLNPNSIEAMQLLPNDAARPLRTRLDCRVGDRGLTVYVIELPAQIIQLCQEEPT